MGGESPEPLAPESLTIHSICYDRQAFIAHASKSGTWCKLPGERMVKGQHLGSVVMSL